MPTKILLAAMVGLSLLLIAATSGEAAVRVPPRRPANNQMNNQQQYNAAQMARLRAAIAAAQSALQAVRDKLTAANAKEADAAARIKTAISGLDGAKSSLRNAEQTMGEIERRILGPQSQDEDSEYAKAEKAYQAAKQKLHDEQQRVLTSPEYLTKWEAALVSPNKADEMFRVRTTALQYDMDFQDALKAYKDTKSDYWSIRQELLKKDPDWAAASKSLLEATAAESDLEAKLQAAVMSDSTAKDLIRRYAPTAQAAQSVLNANGKK